MTTRTRFFGLIAVVTLTIAACGDGTTPHGTPAGTGVPKVSPVGMKEAQELFASLCSTCHGTAGKGDGPGAAALEPKPRSFADAAWQASVTDDHIRKIITFGGAAVGKSVAMPPQPQLKGKPEVLDGLVAIVRSYKQ